MKTDTQEMKRVYSFRLSDDTLQTIDMQLGESRTDKFENLVNSRVASIAEMETQIKHRQQELAGLQKKVSHYKDVISNLEQIERHIKWAMQNVKEDVS